MKRLLACLILAACAAPAAACDNGAELPSLEREFRSSYRKPSGPPATAPMSNGWLLGSGAGLLFGAALAFRGRKK